jgi:hypothetical protein
MGFNLIDWLDDAASSIWDTVVTSAKLEVARGGALRMANKYHLDDDDAAFKEFWNLAIKASIAEHAVHEDAKVEVRRCLGLLKTLADTAPTTATTFGQPIAVVPDDAFLTTQVAPTAGNYVVFSDHHMLFDGARQNFFRHGYRAEDQVAPARNNCDLYLEILSGYYGPANYTLVENGDVEELLIFEPVLSEIRGVGGWSWSALGDYRAGKMLEQLPKIASDNRSYYETIQEQFIGKQKYFRLTGNHDRRMRELSFVNIVRDETGTALPLASDVLLLRGSGEVDYIICHGHQFDTSCTPKYAAKLGENFTMAGAWAYQGPDRNWRPAKDPIEAWASGGEPVLNELVTDQPGNYDTSLQDALDNVPIVGEAAGEISQLIIDALGAALGSLDTERGWENLYGKNIAWEYFDNASSPAAAIEQEVETGDRWFKFRHMDEFTIVSELDRLFDGKPTRLILGHSHEPRFRPGFNVPMLPQRQVDRYLNCASAGRFQNLIWGIELIGGEPFLISWHREDRPNEANVPVRTIWEDDFDGARYILKPVSSATLAELAQSVAQHNATTLRIAADHVE